MLSTLQTSRYLQPIDENVVYFHQPYISILLVGRGRYETRASGKKSDIVIVYEIFNTTLKNGNNVINNLLRIKSCSRVEINKHQKFVVVEVTF